MFSRGDRGPDERAARRAVVDPAAPLILLLGDARRGRDNALLDCAITFANELRRPLGCYVELEDLLVPQPWIGELEGALAARGVGLLVGTPTTRGDCVAGATPLALLHGGRSRYLPIVKGVVQVALDVPSLLEALERNTAESCCDRAARALAAASCRAEPDALHAWIDRARRCSSPWPGLAQPAAGEESVALAADGLRRFVDEELCGIAHRRVSGELVVVAIAIARGLLGERAAVRALLDAPAPRADREVAISSLVAAVRTARAAPLRDGDKMA